jgi:hypothetical protein
VNSLSLAKIVEDHFDYRQARITESLARDLSVLYIGELSTLWKNEFKNLVQTKSAHSKDMLYQKLRRQHKIMGQKILNFVFNLSRRALLMYESKMDLVKQREKPQEIQKE